MHNQNCTISISSFAPALIIHVTHSDTIHGTMILKYDNKMFANIPGFVKFAVTNNSHPNMDASQNTKPSAFPHISNSTIMAHEG